MHVLKTKLCFSSSNHTNVKIDVLTYVKGAKVMVFSRGVKPMNFSVFIGKTIG